MGGGFARAFLGLLDEALIVLAVIGVLGYLGYSAGLLGAGFLLAALVAVLALTTLLALRIAPAMGREPAVGIESYRGKRGVLVSLEPQPLVAIEGEYWRALVVKGEPRLGATVTVLGNEGSTLLVAVAGGHEE